MRQNLGLPPLSNDPCSPGRSSRNQGVLDKMGDRNRIVNNTRINQECIFRQTKPKSVSGILWQKYRDIPQKFNRNRRFPKEKHQILTTHGRNS